MSFSRKLYLEFKGLLKSHDPKVLSWLVQKARAYENIEECIFDNGLDLTAELVAELGLRELILLKPGNVLLQDLWFEFESSHLTTAI